MRSRVFSERYSCTKPTVTTMTMAKAMEAASSNWRMSSEMMAEARSSRMNGLLNCSRYFFHSGSGSPPPT